MEALKSRPYRSIGDLERVIELLYTCRAVEAIDVWPPVYELRRHLRSTDSPGAADTRVWERREGAIAAFATIWDDTRLIACIHPQAHCDALSQEILLWGQVRAREHGLIHGERAGLFVPIRADDHRSGALLERHGFVPEDWSLQRMVRPLHEPVPSPVVPAGYTLRRVASAQELAAAMALHQEVFVAGPAIVRDRLALQQSTDVLVRDLVAIAPDGAFAAFCRCSSSRAGSAPPWRREGWVELLGTRRGYAGRGLGRVVLLAGLQQLVDAGAGIAFLGASNWNVAAQRLFAAVGFELLHHVRWYAWEEGERIHAAWTYRTSSRSMIC
jgi:RimJ/RimL family protein N-acetyltransferase